MLFGDWRCLVALRLFGAAGHLVSFVGLLSIGGMALAVAVLLTVLSVVNGFEKELRERVLAVLPHGTIYPRDAFSDWRSERARMLAHPEVLGVAPVVEGGGLLVKEGRLVGVTFRGVDLALESSVSILPDFVQGRGLSRLADSRYGAILGTELAEQLGVTVGDRVTLVLPDVAFSLAGPVVTARRLTVEGIFRVGADLDKSHIYLNIGDAQKLKRRRDIDGLVIRVADLFQAHRVLHELVTDAGGFDRYGVSWMRQNGNLYDAIRTQKATLFLLLLILVAVAVFNVVSNLVMTVDDHRSAIAILRTMGARPRDVRIIFIWHGMMVGVIGLVLGLMVGWVLTLLLGPLYELLSGLLQLNLMGEYFIRYLPVEVQWPDLLVITVVCLTISLVATIYPAGRAAASRPAEALQYEV